MIPPERLFWPCIVCGDENRYIEMFACLNCEEPICEACARQDGFCSDECYDTFHEGDDEDDWYPGWDSDWDVPREETSKP